MTRKTSFSSRKLVREAKGNKKPLHGIGIAKFNLIQVSFYTSKQKKENCKN